MWLIFLFGLFVSSAHCDLNIPLCPSGGEPVCAKSDYEFIYFENECKLNVYSYQRLFAGKSRPAKIALEECFSNCAGIICPRLYEPVCAQQIPEGPVSTVPNACLVNQLICETRKQWIILAKGTCPETMESSQSNNKVYAVPAASYKSASTHQSTSDHGTNTKLTHNAAPIPSADAAHATAHHIATPYVPASDSAKYTHLLLASATSDKYTIAAYSSPVVAKKSVTNSAPVSYQLSGSKSQQISYTSSGQSASPAKYSSSQHSAPTPVSDSSHVSYASGPSPYPSVRDSPDPTPSQPTYAPASESPSQAATHLGQQSNYAESHQSSQKSANLYETTNSQSEQNSYKSAFPAAVPSPTHYPPSAPASVSYPSEEPATAQYSSGSPVDAPAPAMYEAPNHSSLPAPTSYSHASTHGSPSAESAYQVETTHPAPHSNDYQGSAQTAPPHFGNSQLLNHSPSPSYHAEIPQSVAHTNVNQDALQTTAAQYENLHPSTESSQPEAYSKDYPTAAQPDVPYYENGQPTNEGNSQYENPQLSNRGSSSQTETPQPVANFNEGVAQPVPSHYGRSLPLTQGFPASAGSYQGDTAHQPIHSNDYKEGVQTAPAHYENSHQGSPSIAGTYQGETSPSEQQHMPAHYGNSQLTNEGNVYPLHQASASPQDETVYPTSNTNEYQETAQIDQANYRNSNPTHHSSAPSSESYQAETSYPPQHSSDPQATVQAESEQYENSHTSNQSSQPVTDSHPAETPSSERLPKYYQGPIPTAEAHYENSQPSQQGSSTVSESYPQLPASTDYQEPVDNAPAQYENSDQERGAVADPSSEYDTTHLPSTSTCTEGDHIPTSHISVPAPEPKPALIAPIPASTAYTTSESYPGTIPSSEVQSSAPVNYSATDQYSASPAYSNSVSADSYGNPDPVSSESAYPESAHAPAATPSSFIASDAVSYTPPEVSYSKDSSDASHDLVAVSEQNSHKAAEVASEYAGPSEEHVQPGNQYKAPQSSTNTLPTQETYSQPAPAVNSTYAAPEEYIFQVTHLHKPGNKSSASSSAPHSHQKQQSKHHHSPISSLNIYLAPAAAPAPAHAPAVNVYTIPYRYPLAAPATPSLSSPAQAPVDYINPTEEISEAYDPKLADLVSKWVDRNDNTEYPKNNGYRLGVPFYYQPSFTLIQYNSAKSQHSKK